MAEGVVCSLPELYAWVMSETWKEVKRRKAEGQSVTLEDFSKIIKEKWAEAKRMCMAKSTG